MGSGIMAGRHDNRYAWLMLLHTRHCRAPRSLRLKRLGASFATCTIAFVVTLSAPADVNALGQASNPTAPQPVQPVIEQPPEPVYIVKDKGVVTTPTGLRYVDLVAGKGASPKRGQTAVVHYIGTLANDSVFDDSRKRKDPLECRMGTGRYLRGWEEGLSSMKVGGKRKLIIPPRLGYGRAGNRKMGRPPNAYVIFEVELMAVR